MTDEGYLKPQLQAAGAALGVMVPTNPWEVGLGFSWPTPHHLGLVSMNMNTKTKKTNLNGIKRISRIKIRRTILPKIPGKSAVILIRGEYQEAKS